MKTPTKRFSDRVDTYVRYRPAYPTAVVDTLIETCGLDERSVVADVGSGTGIFTRQLLDRRLRVVGVEPNREMRRAAEAAQTGYGRFTSVDGSAEASTLANRSVDVVVAAQAFHWFDFSGTQREWARILKPPRWVALVWNRRNMCQPFQRAYDALLCAYAPEYAVVSYTNTSDDTIASFFAPEDYRVLTFKNEQTFDREGFLGRIQSSSYTPPAGTDAYLKLAAAAEQLFARHEQNGTIAFEYDTRLYIGQLRQATRCVSVFLDGYHWFRTRLKIRLPPQQGGSPLDMKTLPANAVLLIVDVQQGFDEPSWGDRNNPDAEENVARLLAAWRRTNRPIFHVQHLSLAPDSPLRVGHPGSAIKEEVKPQEGEWLFQKRVNSAFIGTGLEQRLRECGYGALVVVGLTTPHCVSTTARMAGNLGFQTFVVSDATAAFDLVDQNGRRYTAEEIHAVSLATLHGEFATVVETETLLHALK